MSRHIAEDKVRLVKETADGRLLDIISSYVTMTPPRTGTEYKGDCPLCQARGKFCYSASKGVFKCWSCGEMAGRDAVTFLMKGKQMDFQEAIRELARFLLIDLEEEKCAAVQQHPAAPVKGSFCHRMLQESGLTEKDVEATVYLDDLATASRRPTFEAGTVLDGFRLAEGDDAVIRYYDLDGHPVMFERKEADRRKARLMEYFRVRWQFPDAHLDASRRPFKYKSPAGSGTPIYIPEKVRKAYKEKREIARLFIQEGEKKAEKASKHGLLSVAVSGIQNLGYHGSLPEDLIRIIRQCQVREVVFLMDSDYNDLSRQKRINEDVAQRPRSFFYAARNYKAYMRALSNLDMFVEIYLGHTIRHGDDKGIDDLLTHTLAGHEDDFLSDLETAINLKEMRGKYVELFRITSWTDLQIERIWGLESPASFVKMHQEELRQLPEFLFGRHRLRLDEKGEPVPAQPFDDDEKFWEEYVKTDPRGQDQVFSRYRYVEAKNFLRNRGFGRYRLQNGMFSYVHYEPPFVENVQAADARDYLVQFAEINCSRTVLEMLYKGSVQYIGPDKLSMLPYIEPPFLDSTRDTQYFYFQQEAWKITEGRVESLPYAQITHAVWKERRKDFEARYVGALVTFRKLPDGGYRYELSQHGRQCHFLSFLENASDFTWRKKQKHDQLDRQEEQENTQHLLSKLCAIGYMAMDAKDPNVARAVIAMDGKQSEVGESNGRSGKSLVGELMRHITTIAYINGKKRDILDDQFIWNDITEKTRLVFIDDVLQNFNFEFLFPCITGDWTVNYKGAQRITYPFRTSPKIYIPTNHTIKGDGSSFEDRQWVIAFSDFYNQVHKPQDDFESLFFSEWDYDQWNLTWNLVANCIQLYLRFGVVQAPRDRIDTRRLRQEITEGFILWADEYYSDRNRIGIQISRRELQENYFQADPQQRKYVTPTEFKKRFKKYCLFRGYRFNPQLYDPQTGQPFRFDRDGRPITDDKSAGTEYFTIAPVGDACAPARKDSQQPKSPLPAEPDDDDAPF